MSTAATAVEQATKAGSFTDEEFKELCQRFAASGKVILPVLESMVGSMFHHNMSRACIRDSIARAVAVDVKGHVAALDKERGADKLAELGVAEKEFLSLGFDSLVGDALHNGLVDWEESHGGADAEAEKTPRPIAFGGAEIFADEGKTIAYFTNTMLAGRDEVRVGFSPSTDSYVPPNSYSIPLFVNGDMIAADHGATWEQAMAYIRAVLSAKTAEEAAGRYGELHPRFTADELVRRARNPNWESELAQQTAA